MREVTIEKIIEMLNACINNLAITTEQVDKDLTKMGMDSIAFIRLVISLEEEFECEIPNEKLLITEMNTVYKISEVLISIQPKTIT